jgi:hypothetical protein
VSNQAGYSLFLVADVAWKEALTAREAQPSIGALVVLAHSLVREGLPLDNRVVFLVHTPGQ